MIVEPDATLLLMLRTRTPVLTAMSIFRARSEASFGLLVIPAICCFKMVSAAATTSDVLRSPMHEGGHRVRETGETAAVNGSTHRASGIGAAARWCGGLGLVGDGLTWSRPFEPLPGFARRQ